MLATSFCVYAKFPDLDVSFWCYNQSVVAKGGFYPSTFSFYSGDLQTVIDIFFLYHNFYCADLAQETCRYYIHILLSKSWKRFYSDGCNGFIIVIQHFIIICKKCVLVIQMV